MKFENEKYAVIPDIHGNVQIMEKAIKVLKSFGVKNFLFLGDYIDRGKYGPEVISRLMNPLDDENFVCLRGNHEDMFIEDWENASLYYPRDSVERQYLIEKVSNDGTNFTAHDAAKWFSSLPYYVIIGKNVFAHAFYTENCDYNTMIWKRLPTGTDYYDSDMFLTHGHTPHTRDKIDMGKNRLNLDIGAYSKLTGGICVAIFSEHPEKLGPETVFIVNDDETIENVDISSTK